MLHSTFNTFGISLYPFYSQINMDIITDYIVYEDKFSLSILPLYFESKFVINDNA